MCVCGGGNGQKQMIHHTAIVFHNDCHCSVTSVRMILGKWKQKPNGRGLKNKWKVSKWEEGCGELDHSLTKKGDVGCSLKGEKRFACLHPEEDLIMSKV